MMRAPETRRVALAAVAGAHGIRGELRLKLFTDNIEGLSRHASVFVDDRPYALESAKMAGKIAIARLAGVADRTAAEALRGRLIEVERSALPPLEDGEYYHADLVGMACVGLGGEPLGKVSAVENFGAGDLLEIESEQGKRSLVPFRGGIADLEGERVVVDPAFLA